MQRSTPSIHVIFIEARPENESPMLNDLSAGYLMACVCIFYDSDIGQIKYSFHLIVVNF